MYYEGNDIKDLNWERDNTNLINYLDDNYIQNHLSRYDDIEFFLDEIFKEHLLIVEDYKLQNNASANDIEFNLKKRNNFIESLKDIAELRRLKNFYKNYILSGTNSNFDEELFFSIIKKMNEETKSWKGNFIFIYVPSWERFFTKFTKRDSFFNEREKIIKEINEQNISLIDLTKFLYSADDKKKYYPLGYYGHFNELGYRTIADIIEKKVKNFE